MQFDDWNNSEKYELEAALGGVENMANFNYVQPIQSDLVEDAEIM